MTSACVHILGSGTCFPCRGLRRAHPGFFIRWGEEDAHLLLECSQGIAERLETIGESADRVRHLAISHAHPDHCALPHFLQAAMCTGMTREEFGLDQAAGFRRLGLYTPGHILRFLNTLQRFSFEETVETDGRAGLAFPVLDPVVDMSTPGSAVGLPGACLKSFRVPHGFGKVDALAFRLEIADGPTIAYSGDSGWSHELVGTAQDADVFICEASARIDDDHNAFAYGHLNPHQAGKIAWLARARRLYLTHYSGADSDEAMITACRSSGFEGEIVIAKDGFTIEL